MMTLLDNLRRIGIFASVVDERGFSRAAVKLGLTRSAVSRQVAQLEQHFGVRPLNRTTRQLSLTEAGRRLHATAARVLSEVHQPTSPVGACPKYRKIWYITSG